MFKDPYTAQPIVSGMWKFADTVPLERLIALGRGWGMGANGDHYLDIHIRQCSKNQHGIGFKYRLDLDGSEGDWKRQHQRFFHRMKEQLENDFGKDFVGWDVTSSTHIIL